jgi:hypothetical protein
MGDACVCPRPANSDALGLDSLPSMGRVTGAQKPDALGLDGLPSMGRVKGTYNLTHSETRSS